MKLLICLTILAAVAFVNCHPAMYLLNDSETLENVDANAGVDSSVDGDDAELIRKSRSFGRGFCCRGGGYRRPYFGGGGFRRPYGGGGFSGASASASASSFGGGFGYGK